VEVKVRVRALQDLHVLVLDLLAKPFHVDGHIVDDADLPLSHVPSAPDATSTTSALATQEQASDADRAPSCAGMTVHPVAPG
jgi:hypothetical protein